MVFMAHIRHSSRSPGTNGTGSSLIRLLQRPTDPSRVEYLPLDPRRRLRHMPLKLIFIKHLLRRLNILILKQTERLTASFNVLNLAWVLNIKLFILQIQRILSMLL